MGETCLQRFFLFPKYLVYTWHGGDSFGVRGNVAMQQSLSGYLRKCFVGAIRRHCTRVQQWFFHHAMSLQGRYVLRLYPHWRLKNNVFLLITTHHT